MSVYRTIGPLVWIELLTRLTICPRCDLSNCSYFLCWFRGQDLGSDFPVSDHSLSFTFGSDYTSPGSSLLTFFTSDEHKNTIHVTVKRA